MNSTQLLLENIERELDKLHNLLASDENDEKGTQAVACSSTPSLKRRLIHGATIVRNDEAPAKAVDFHANAAKHPSSSRFSSQKFLLGDIATLVPFFIINLHHDHALIYTPSKEANAIKIENNLSKLLYFLAIEQIPPFLETILMECLFRQRNPVTLPQAPGTNAQNSQTLAPFFEGNLCVEVVDLRSPGSPLSNRPFKILLKPNAACLENDLSVLKKFAACSSNDKMLRQTLFQKLEQKIVHATADPLVLEPSALVLPVMTWSHFQKHPLKNDAISFKRNLQKNPYLSQRITQSSESRSGEFIPKYKKLLIAEEFRKKKASFEDETLSDYKATLFKAYSTTTQVYSSKISMINANLVRTVKFERDSDENRTPLFVTLYVLANSQIPNKFDGFLRFGSQPESSKDGFSVSFAIGGVRMVEGYISCLKSVLSIQEQNIKCTSDLINPISKTNFGPMKAMSSNGAATSARPSSSASGNIQAQNASTMNATAAVSYAKNHPMASNTPLSFQTNPAAISAPLILARNAASSASSAISMQSNPSGMLNVSVPGSANPYGINHSNPAYNRNNNYQPSTNKTSVNLSEFSNVMISQSPATASRAANSPDSQSPNLQMSRGIAPHLIFS